MTQKPEEPEQKQEEPERKRSFIRPDTDMLRLYTGSDFHSSLNALVNAIGGLSEDLNKFRDELRDFRGEINTIREHNARQDQELWDAEGASRLKEALNRIVVLDVRVKGLWAVVGVLVTAILAFTLAHIR